jgi:Flp pilus assembly protein TadG
MKNNGNVFKRFLGSENGGVLILVAVALLLLLACVGTALDTWRAFAVNTTIHEGVLEGANAVLNTDNHGSQTINAWAQDTAQNYFNANYSAGYINTTPIHVVTTLTPVPGTPGKFTVKVAAQTVQTTTILSIFGINSVTVSAVNTPAKAILTPVPAVCGSIAGQCTPGTPQNFNAATNTWQCQGSGGAPLIDCSLAVPVKGVCGSMSNKCTPGTVSNLVTNNGKSTWICDGVNGGQPSGSCSSDDGICSKSNVVSTCDQGNAINLKTSGNTSTWDCQGTNGGNTALGCNSSNPLNGVCGTGSESCKTGTPANFKTSGANTTWDCLGANGGSNALACAASTPINGLCGGTVSVCTAGSVANLIHINGVSTWTCQGSGGGSNASCNMPDLVNGLCSSKKNTCDAGNVSNQAYNNGTATWKCNGINGGATASCQILAGTFYALDAPFKKHRVAVFNDDGSYSYEINVADNIGFGDIATDSKGNYYATTFLGRDNGIGNYNGMAKFDRFGNTLYRLPDNHYDIPPDAFATDALDNLYLLEMHNTCDSPFVASGPDTQFGATCTYPYKTQSIFGKETIVNIKVPANPNAVVTKLDSNGNKLSTININIPKKFDHIITIPGVNGRPSTTETLFSYNEYQIPKRIKVDADGKLWALYGPTISYMEPGEQYSFTTTDLYAFDSSSNVINRVMLSPGPYFFGTNTNNHSAVDIAFDNQHNVWVTSSDNHHGLRKFDMNGNVLYTPETGQHFNNNTAPGWPTWVDVDADNNVWISEFSVFHGSADGGDSGEGNIHSLFVKYNSYGTEIGIAGGVQQGTDPKNIHDGPNYWPDGINQGFNGTAFAISPHPSFR